MTCMKKAFKRLVLSLAIFWLFPMNHAAAKSDQVRLKTLEKSLHSFIKQATKDFFEQIQKTPIDEPIKLHITEQSAVLAEKLTLKLITNWYLFTIGLKQILSKATEKILLPMIKNLSNKNDRAECATAFFDALNITFDIASSIAIKIKRQSLRMKKRSILFFGFFSTITGAMGIKKIVLENGRWNFVSSFALLFTAFTLFDSCKQSMKDFDNIKKTIKTLNQTYKDEICQKSFCKFAQKPPLKREQIDVADAYQAMYLYLSGDWAKR